MDFDISKRIYNLLKLSCYRQYIIDNTEIHFDPSTSYQEGVQQPTLDVDFNVETDKTNASDYI